MEIYPEKLLRKSVAMTKKESRFGYWTSLIFFPQRQRQLLFLLYAYLRWVDDRVDREKFNFDDTYVFMRRQIEIVHASYQGKTLIPNNSYEAMAVTAINEDRKKGSQLENMLNGFLQAINWDVQRRYKLVCQNDLNQYSLLLGRSYSEGLLFGLQLDPCDPTYAIPKNLCGIAAHWTHLLRDLRDDIKLGYTNISEEEICYYSIDFQNTETLRQWTRVKCCQTLELFEEGRKARSVLPTYKSRAVFDLTCLKHISTINRIMKQI